MVWITNWYTLLWGGLFLCSQHSLATCCSLPETSRTGALWVVKQSEKQCVAFCCRTTKSFKIGTTQHSIDLELWVWDHQCLKSLHTMNRMLVWFKLSANLSCIISSLKCPPWHNQHAGAHLPSALGKSKPHTVLITCWKQLSVDSGPDLDSRPEALCLRRCHQPVVFGEIVEYKTVMSVWQKLHIQIMPLKRIWSLLIPFILLIPGCHEGSRFSSMIFCLAIDTKAMEPTDHRLNPLWSWFKINSNSLWVISQVFCHSDLES